MQDAIATHLNTPAPLEERQRNACKPFHSASLCLRSSVEVAVAFGVSVASMTNSLLACCLLNGIQFPCNGRSSISYPRRLSLLVPAFCLPECQSAAAFYLLPPRHSGNTCLACLLLLLLLPMLMLPLPQLLPLYLDAFQVPIVRPTAPNLFYFFLSLLSSLCL